MAVNKLDPKVIFASEAPAQDTPAVFTNRTVGWGETRKNGGRPTIKQMNAEQQSTDLKILWLNENAVTPYDATIDYPNNTVTIKDGTFKIFNGTSWSNFLDKSSVGLSNVDNTSDLNKPVSIVVRAELDYIDKNGAALPYDSSLTYEENAVVVKDGELQKKQGAGWVSAANKGYNLDYFVSGKSYPLHAEIMLANGNTVKSTVANNINDPNVNMTGWQPLDQKTAFVSNKTDGIAAALGMVDGSIIVVKTDESVTLKGTRVAYTVVGRVLTDPVDLSSGLVTPSAYGIPKESESLVNQDAAFATLSSLIHPAKIWLDGRYRVSNNYVTAILPRCAGHGTINGIHTNNDTPFLNEQIIKPSWFTWDSGIKPYYALDNTWKINVDPQSLDVAFNAVGKVTKYVDTATGNDSNSGDAAGVGQAWKSVNKALTWAKLNQSTVPNLVIMIQAGLYNRNEFWVAANATPTAQNISMRAVGGKVYLSKQYEAQSWTVASGAIYQATRSAVGSVWDSLNLDVNGHWSKLKLTGTTQASVVAAGQWATNGTTVWVWNLDGRSPDANNRLMVTGTGCYITNLQGQLYCEGISFFGGEAAMKVSTDNSVTSKQYFNDCEFAYSTASNSLNIEGTDGCYTFNSRVFRAHRDGLNYHINADLLKNCNVFEFNVVSKHNGMSGDSNNNASTGHDGAIIQRVGGEYAYSEGPNLPDVNGCLTWNTGIVVHDSMSPEAGTRYGMYVQGGGKLHCDFCKSYNHRGDVVVQASTGSIFTTRGWLGSLDIVYS